MSDIFTPEWFAECFDQYLYGVFVGLKMLGEALFQALQTYPAVFIILAIFMTVKMLVGFRRRI